MTAYVEECRQEWKRLGVPDLLAEEMAADLEADLAEAEADGVSATEMLGESDPRRFAATWAGERGLVAEQRPPRRRRRWPWVVLAFVLLFGFLASLVLSVGGDHPAAHQDTPSTVSLPIRAPNVVVPSLVGEHKRAALASSRAAGLSPEVTVAARPGAAGTVVEQQPAPGTRLRRGSTVRLFVARG
jgi:hypothetical protein